MTNTLGRRNEVVNHRAPIRPHLNPVGDRLQRRIAYGGLPRERQAGPLCQIQSSNPSMRIGKASRSTIPMVPPQSFRRWRIRFIQDRMRVLQRRRRSCSVHRGEWRGRHGVCLTHCMWHGLWRRRAFRVYTNAESETNVMPAGPRDNYLARPGVRAGGQEYCFVMRAL